MNAESIVIAVIYLVLLLFLGIQIGEGNYEFAILGLVSSAVIYFAIKISKKARIESIILSFLILGYMLGGRGFAWLNIGGIFVGEAAMVAILGLTVIRILVGEFPIVKHKIFISILVYCVYCSIRFILIDLPQYLGDTRAVLTCVRDFAMVYYAIFFIFAYLICNHRPSYNFLKKTIILGIYLCFPLTFMEYLKPELFWNFSYMSRVKDTQGFTSVLGVLYFSYIAFNGNSKLKSIHFIMSIVSIIFIFVSEARTAYVAFAVCMIYILFSGNLKNYFYQMVILFLIGTLTISLVLFGVIKDDSKIASVAFHVISLVDLEGKISNEELDDARDTNEWRLLWWKVIYDELRSSETTTLFGLGFGYHLGARFAEAMLEQIMGQKSIIEGTGDYYEARSPHNYLVTIIGRTGYFGLIITLIFIIQLFILVAENTSLVRSNRANFYLLLYSLFPLCLMVQSWFSIVLEGPYGAIPFWSFLGLSVSDIINKRYRLDDNDKFSSS